MDKRIEKLLSEEGHHVKSDRTLNGYAKKELIEIIRCLEHNFGVCLHVSKRRYLMNMEFVERYSPDEVSAISRKVDAKMSKEWE